MPVDSSFPNTKFSSEGTETLQRIGSCENFRQAVRFFLISFEFRPASRSISQGRANLKSF